MSWPGLIRPSSLKIQKWNVLSWMAASEGGHGNKAQVK